MAKPRRRFLEGRTAASLAALLPALAPALGGDRVMVQGALSEESSTLQARLAL